MTLLEIAQRHPIRFVNAYRIAEAGFSDLATKTMGFTLQEYLSAPALLAIAERRANG